MVIVNKILIGGSKHAKLDQKAHMPKIPFQNMIIFKNTKNKIGKFFIFHFENIYASIGFIVSEYKI